jgi:predicted Zn-dependent peptidase
MSRLGRLEISLGRHVPLEEVLAKIEAVTVEKMKENAAAWLDWRQSSLTVLGPLQGLEDRAFLYADRSEEEMA